MKKLDSIDFPRAKQWLDDHLPRSVVLSQWLRVNIDRPDGVGTSEKSVCYVDRWPNPRILAGVDFMKCYGSDAFPKMCLFAEDDEEDSERIEAFLLELIEELEIALIGGCEIKAIASRSRPSCDKVSAMLGIASSITVWYCRGYWMAPWQCAELARRTIHPPVGFQFDTLDPIESELVDSTWPHRIEGGTLSLMERQIRYFPNACLRATTIDDERLACFELIEAEVGIMSHLYTMCEFRRRGLATVVEMKLAQSLVQNDQIPVKAVLVGNESGEAMTRASGLWSYFGDIVWIRYGNEEMSRRFLEVDGGGGVH